MRLFGVLDDTIDRFDRATFVFMPPFDGSLTAEAAEPQWVNTITVEAGAVLAVAWRPRQTFSTDRRGR